MNKLLNKVLMIWGKMHINIISREFKYYIITNLSIRNITQFSMLIR